MAKNDARHGEEIMEIRAIIDCKTSLGEGPLWDVQEAKDLLDDSSAIRYFAPRRTGRH